jgi:LytS/YehU family sensor histidine kinase
MQLRCLPIHIHTQKANYLTVTNNLQLRTHTENGTKLGLHNIKKRYKHYTELTVSVKKSDTKFTVELPLLT